MMKWTLRKQFLRMAVVAMLVAFCATFAAADGHKVDINTAGIEQLMTLKHVGEVLAKRIMEFREKTPFKSPEEIMLVKGIGQKVFEVNKDRIIIALEN